MIYTSLVALIYNPDLWAEFHTGENLIFSAADFKAPQKSKVFEQLYRSSEPLVRALSQQLAKACEGVIQNVPDFAQAIANLPDLPAPKPWYVADESARSPKIHVLPRRKQPRPHRGQRRIRLLIRTIPNAVKPPVSNADGSARARASPFAAPRRRG